MSSIIVLVKPHLLIDNLIKKPLLDFNVFKLSIENYLNTFT